MYAVSGGEYSGYGVLALFTTRELAEAHIAQRDDDENYGAPFIEEFQVFDRNLPRRVTWYEIQVQMNEDGSWPPNDIGPYERSGWEYAAPSRLSMRPRTELLYSEPYERQNYSTTALGEPDIGPGQYGLFGHCLDREALGKLASDVVAQWKAQGYKLHNAKPWADQEDLLG